MGQISLPWSSFNCGELSPLLEGRTDMPQYMKGGKTMLNFLPTVQGPAIRRGGSRFIGNPVVPNQPCVLIRFSRSQTESYVLSFCDQQLRFYFNGGLVVDGGGNPYHITTPYTQADLFNADGSPAITAVESADVVYLAHPKYPPQVLSFFGPLNWTIAPLKNVDGPWMDVNPDLTNTIYATGGITIGSTVTLTAAVPGTFQSGHVGSLFRLQQQDTSTIKPWAPGQMNSAIFVGVLRRSGFNTYQCANNSAGTPPAGGTSLLFVQTGGNTLVHTEGLAWDGDQSTTITPLGSSTYYSTGMQWSYQDSGYGVVVITHFTDSQTVIATVLRQLPWAVISVSGASNIWQMGQWNQVNGYPSVVTFFRQRLTYGGGQRLWMSVVGDFTNFADKFFGEVLPDSAVTVQCLSDQVNEIVYMSPADTLFVGTTGGEFIVGQQSISDAFGPGNVQVSLQSSYGGRAVPPTRVQQYTLFVTKNGRIMRESTFAFTAGPSGSFVSTDLTVLSEHITQGGIIATAWAKNPYTTIWCVLGDGNLISFIYNPEQQVRNWERHSVVGKVIALCVVPSGTGDWDDVYIEVGRVVDPSGIIRYSIERLEQPYAGLAGDRQQDCFYVDCGASLYNTISATLTPGANAMVEGATDVPFTVDQIIFAPGDVGRFIHYDWTSTQIGDDGLPKPKPMKAIAQITAYVSVFVVEATIISAWPALTPIAADGWRLTVTQVSGQAEWFNQTVSLLGDGACMPDLVYPDSGIIDLPFPCSVVQAGIKSPAVFTTMKLEGGDRTGTAIGKIKRIVRFTLRLLNSLGLRLGITYDTAEKIEMRPPETPNDNPPPLVTGDSERLTFDGDWDRSGRWTVVCDQPLPCTLIAGAGLAEVEEDS